MALKLIYSSILLVALFQGAAAPHYRVFETKLSSGKKVQGIWVRPIADGSPLDEDSYKLPPKLLFEYETEVDVDDKAAIRKEVDEIWAVFQQDVEEAHLTKGVIRPIQRIVRGYPEFSYTKEGPYFVFEKRDDGRWHCLDDDRKVP